MDWNDENIARIRQFWMEGHSTAEIGRRLGVSKNAIVGKAHRLDLPARPSPIRRATALVAAARPSAPRQQSIGPTLPMLASATSGSLNGASTNGASIIEASIIEASTIPASTIPAGEPPARPAPAPPAVPRVAVSTPGELPSPRLISVPPGLRAVTARTSRSVPCCWPIGEPGTKSFRFCDAEAASGKPYCAEHAQIAYVKVRDRREEAA